ncbi:haloacid dehalogenase-like hydrolase [Microbulbifer agarilyticus]|uniref:HAD family hydrolase n=1 Tax=Microbulbifer agarilyticus TaxID=260552 RepID=UPI001C947E81|nr:HAD family hydrolase [Microbulbifer agarilyticus]MBY6188837.1 haloacid dehalogenase-like hydrolase [Microbulbifer agarilyticus]
MQLRILPYRFATTALWLLVVCLACLSTGVWAAASNDPLPSWSDGKTKQAIVSFVEKTTREGSPDFVPENQRIATFDNDGTLWAEQPVYFQLIYALDQVKKMAPQHPEWKTEEPFASALKGDMNKLVASGKEGLMKIIGATHANMTADEFSENVSQWLKTARHPKTNRPYNEMVYQPMLELLNYLRANGFKTFIVSGGGTNFLRVFAEQTYGIPPDQVVGSSLKAEYQVRDGKPEIIKLADINLINDKAGKPVGIHQHIGQRPIFAAGNSDGDFQMLEWTTAGEGPRFGLLLHHTDDKREWAYDRKSHVGRLDQGLDQAANRGWLVIDMQEDWDQVFPGTIN